MVGTFFWVTPGRFSAYGKYVCHPLDGDGLALAITFDAEGRVFVRHRLVQTQGLLRDDTLEATCSNGVHGTPGQQDRLLATWPYGSPYNLDPGSLATLIGADDAGSTDLGGLLLPGKPLSTFGPRPKLDPKGTITSYGVKPDLLGTRVNIYEARESWRSRYPKTAPRSVGLPGYSWVTDSASTPRWAVLAVPPCKADAFAAAQGKHPAQVLSWDEGASGALVFATRAKEGAKEATVKLDGRAVESIANAFEAEGDSGRVTVDAAAADGWVLAPQAPEGASPERPFWEVLSPDSAPRAQLVRYEVDLQAETFTKKVLLDRHVVSPCVDPSRAGSASRYVFCGVAHGEGPGPTGGACRVDAATGAADVWVASPTESSAAPPRSSRSRARRRRARATC
ncbi:unnamed protein product [Prorocentrum cordatum]|uniref:Amine oxidase n=1 Tax=Prorocentrum cordatum TaxID=2364126 RepID=A0ABN9Y827_9DINO|nr:unnamed protein product [Polarella glacialis]